MPGIGGVLQDAVESFDQAVLPLTLIMQLDIDEASKVGGLGIIEQPAIVARIAAVADALTDLILFCAGDEFEKLGPNKR